MSSIRRDRILLVLLPSAVVALAWWGWFRPSAQLRDALQQEQTAKAAVPSAAILAAQHTKTDKLKTEDAQLAKQRKAWLSQWEQMRSERNSSQGRAAALARVTSTLRNHNLTLLREEPPSKDKGSSGGKVLYSIVNRLRKPAAEFMPEIAAVQKVEAKGTATTKGAASTRPTTWSSKGLPTSEGRVLADSATAQATWKIEFAGHYDDVVAALAELAEANSTIVPIQLSMIKAKPNLSLRRWTLVLVL